MAAQDPFRFRYLRMRADVGQAFSGGTATCSHVHEKEGVILLAIGFVNGEVIVVDSYGIEKCRWRAHATPVNAISSDISGSHFASCSDDGNVSVRQVAGDQSNDDSLLDTLETQTFGQPLECLQIDPFYGKKNEKIFITGGPHGQLILSRKSWYSQKDVVVHDGEGAITSVCWHGSLLAWSNERGVKIIDVETNEKITFVERPPNEEPGCLLFWESSSSLIIVWERTIQIIKQCSLVLSPNEEPRMCAEIQKVWEIGLDHTICGLVPFDSETFALLCVVRELEEENQEDQEEEPDEFPMPELQLRNRLTGELIVIPDALPIQGYQKVPPECFQLRASSVPKKKKTEKPTDSTQDAILKAPTLFMISPHEVVVAKVRDFDDQITSALQQHRYREALDIARAHPLSLRRHRLPDLTQQFLEDLLYHEEFEEAAAVCPALFHFDAYAWEFWILRFMKCGQLHTLAPHIPTDAPRLEPAVYQLVLDHFLSTSSEAFLSTIKLWGTVMVAGRGESSVYSLPTTMAHIQSRLKDEGPDPLLIEAQALLYAKTRQYEDALNCYLRLDSSNVNDVESVFAMIEEHCLYGSVRNKVSSLIRLDRELSGKLLLKATNEIPIEVVVRQLEGSPELTLWYLHLLYQKQLELYNEAHYGTLHMKQVQLYVEIDQKSVDFLQPPEGQDGLHHSPMIGFLKWSWNANNVSDFYQIAYDLCKERQQGPLWNEMIFILGATQRAEEALDLLLVQVGDVRRAIEFVESEKDSAIVKVLWDSLIQFSLENKTFLTGMLDYAGLYSIELPSRIIKEIPLKMEIKGLKKKLVSITEDYHFQKSLQLSCRNAMEVWFYNERTKLFQLKRRGCRVTSTSSLSQTAEMMNSSQPTEAPTTGIGSKPRKRTLTIKSTRQ